MKFVLVTLCRHKGRLCLACVLDKRFMPDRAAFSGPFGENAG